MTQTTSSPTTGMGGWSRPGAGRGVSDLYRHPLKVWPYTWASVKWFLVAFAGLTALFTVLGWMVVSWLEPSTLGEAEAGLNVWLEEQRTPGLNQLATVASLPSDTPVKIGLMVLLLITVPVVWRRWHDWAFLLGALVLEVSVYGLSSFIVGRPRPDVERLTSAPTQSFPSGHVAAALTFYVGLAIIAHWHTENRAVRIGAWVVGLVVPVAMIASRLYLGMHFVSDVIGGLLLGALSLIIALHIARHGLRETRRETDELLPGNTRHFDLT